MKSMRTGGTQGSEVGSQKAEGGGQNAKWKMRNGKVQKYVAVLAILAALQKSSGNRDVIQHCQDRQVAAWERARFLATRIRRGEARGV